MASVVVSILKKRGKGGGRSAEDESFRENGTGRRENPVPFLARSGSAAGRFLWGAGRLHHHHSGQANKRLVAEEVAAQAVQRMWRGYQIRQHMKSLLTENTVSWTSVTEALETLARWHIGWSRFLLHLIVLALYIVTIYFQIYYEKPLAFDTNDAILARLNDPSFDAPPVRYPKEVMPYLKALVGDLYHQEIINNTFCMDQLNEYCRLNTNRNDSQFETILAQNCTPSDPETSGSVYVDHANQLLGASYVTQTRRMEKPCPKRFTQFGGSEVSNTRRSRACLDGSEEAHRFASDLCPRNASQAQNPTCEAIYSGTQDEFIFRPQDGYYLFPLHVGFAFRLPVQAIQCKIDRMQRSNWLDARTKRVCIKFGFLNKNEAGRIMLYEECFLFNLGGSVSRSFQIASTSLYTDAIVPIALTWTAIAVVLVRLILDLMLFINERRARGRLRYKRPLFTLSGLLGLIPSILLLAQSILFLVMVYSIQKAETDALEASEIITNGSTNSTASGTVVFLEALTDADWAVKMWVAFVTIVAISLIIMLGRSIVLMGFHPTSAIISGTLSKASSHLGCFFIIFAMVVLIYAYVGMILLGRTRPEFASFGSAINNLLFFTVGEVERAYDFIFVNSPDAVYVVVIQALYFWSYVLLCTILLMNVLLSIIVGAFVDLQEKAEKHTTYRPVLGFLRSLATSLAFIAEGFLDEVCRLCPSRFRARVVRRSCECTTIRTCCTRCCGSFLFTRQSSAIRTESLLQAAAAKSPQREADGAAGHDAPPEEGDLGKADDVEGNAGANVDKLEATDGSMLQLTPWERLVAFNRFRPVTGIIETRTLRQKLHLVYHSETTVEHIISWCRTKTRVERMQKFTVHLKGLDPDSALLKGHELFLLESILKRVGPASGRFERATNSSSRSLRTINSRQSSGSRPPAVPTSEDERAVESAALSPSPKPVDDGDGDDDEPMAEPFPDKDVQGEEQQERALLSE